MKNTRTGKMIIRGKGPALRWLYSRGVVLLCAVLIASCEMANTPPADISPMDTPPTDTRPADTPPADIPPANIPPAEPPPNDTGTEPAEPGDPIDKSAPPLLDWYSPADGASVRAGDATMELHFSCPMERLSVESALTVDGMGNKTFEWSSDDRMLKVIPEKSPAARTVCRWSLKESARSKDGVPLAKAISAQFTIEPDQIPPRVQKVYPVLYSEGRWLPTGFDIETGLGPGQGIAVEFSKAMSVNVLRSLSFEPALSGRTELLSEKAVIYIPDGYPEQETVYTLIVSGDTMDSEGLKLGGDFRTSFVAGIPFLRVLSFSADKAPDLICSPVGISDGEFGKSFRVPVDAAAGELSFTIRFSLPFTTAEKQNAVSKISLVPYYPGYLAFLDLTSASWISDDQLRMTWKGLVAGSAELGHFYKLVIKGGKGGITNGGGMYFKEDQYLFLEAIK